MRLSALGYGQLTDPNKVFTAVEGDEAPVAPEEFAFLGSAILGQNQLAVADAFLDRVCGDVRWVPEWGKWIIWDGNRWILDRGEKMTSQMTTVYPRYATVYQRSHCWRSGKRQTCQGTSGVRKKLIPRWQPCRDGLAVPT